MGFDTRRPGLRKTPESPHALPEKFLIDLYAQTQVSAHLMTELHQTKKLLGQAVALIRLLDGSPVSSARNLKALAGDFQEIFKKFPRGVSIEPPGKPPRTPVEVPIAPSTKPVEPSRAPLSRETAKQSKNAPSLEPVEQIRSAPLRGGAQHRDARPGLKEATANDLFVTAERTLGSVTYHGKQLIILCGFAGCGKSGAITKALSACENAVPIVVATNRLAGEWKQNLPGGLVYTSATALLKKFPLGVVIDDASLLPPNYIRELDSPRVIVTFDVLQRDAGLGFELAPYVTRYFYATRRLPQALAALLGVVTSNSAPGYLALLKATPSEDTLGLITAYQHPKTLTVASSQGVTFETLTNVHVTQGMYRDQDFITAVTRSKAGTTIYWNNPVQTGNSVLDALAANQKPSSAVLALVRKLIPQAELTSSLAPDKFGEPLVISPLPEVPAEEIVWQSSAPSLTHMAAVGAKFLTFAAMAGAGVATVAAIGSTSVVTLPLLGTVGLPWVTAAASYVPFAGPILSAYATSAALPSMASIAATGLGGLATASGITSGIAGFYDTTKIKHEEHSHDSTVTDQTLDLPVVPHVPDGSLPIRSPEVPLLNMAKSPSMFSSALSTAAQYVPDITETKNRAVEKMASYAPSLVTVEHTIAPSTLPVEVRAPSQKPVESIVPHLHAPSIPEVNAPSLEPVELVDRVPAPPEELVDDMALQRMRIVISKAYIAAFTSGSYSGFLRCSAVKKGWTSFKCDRCGKESYNLKPEDVCPAKRDDLAKTVLGLPEASRAIVVARKLTS